MGSLGTAGITVLFIASRMPGKPSPTPSLDRYPVADWPLGAWPFLPGNGKFLAARGPKICGPWRPRREPRLLQIWTVGLFLSLPEGEPPDLEEPSFGIGTSLA